MKRNGLARITFSLAWLIAAAPSGPALAQIVPPPAPPDTLETRPPVPGQDEPVMLDPAGEPATGPPGARDGDGIEHPITFSARDSLVILFAPNDDPDGDVGTLYGDAHTVYDDATLTAHEIDLLFQREILRARGAPTETAPALGTEAPQTAETARPGIPTFQRGSEGFTGRELAYHLGTRRGRVVGARTALHDGFLHGGTVVQAGPRITYAEDVIYTTCDYDDHTHWGLHTHRMKVVDGEWVYTGAARLHILGIPTPVWLPFGFFPAAEGRRSGPLPPDYGEQMDLGFYVRNIGYYWALSDYLDLQVGGGFYTSGSYEGESAVRYARRYRFDGSLRLRYRFEKRGEPQDPGYVAQRQAGIAWRHNQTLDAVGNTRLSGNVDLRSSGIDRSIASDYDQRTTQQTTSNLNLTHRWRNGRNISLSYRQNLNISNGSTNLVLPEMRFSQPRWFPFKREGVRRGILDQISLQYNNTFRNTYVFTPTSDTTDVTWLQGLFSHDDFVRATGQDRRFDAQATHNLPLNAQISVRRLPGIGALQLDMSPSVTYREDWYFDRRELRVGDGGFAVRDTLGNLQFDHTTAFTPVRQATFNVSASTRMFGTFPLRVGSFDGFRHEVMPSVSFSYSPDYSGGFWGHVDHHIEPDGTVVDYTVRQGVSMPGRPAQAIGLSLQNVFQGRVAREDETGEVHRRVVQLLNLSLTSGYNLAADSLNWQDLQVNARSTIAEQVSLNLSAAYSPYAVDQVGIPQNRFYLSETGLPLRFLRANFNASTSLRGGRGGRQAGVAAPPQRPLHRGDLDQIGTDGLYPYDFRRPDLGFVDFSIPWSLGLDFNYGITRNFAGGEDQTYATLNSSFDLGITRQWRVSGRSGYDFDNGEFVPTQISVLRELHCWEMSFTWLPFGQVRAFSFSIYVRSGHLRDLLRLDVPNVDRTPHF